MADGSHVMVFDNTRSELTSKTDAVEPEQEKVRFRTGLVDDAETIAEYHHRCWRTSFAALLEPGTVERMDPSGKLDRLRFWLSAESAMTTEVATNNNVVVGHVTVEGNEVVHLFVDPLHHGLGIGRRLLGRGERLLAQAGNVDAELHTIVGNEPAIGLYRSAGWRLTDRLVHSEHDGVAYHEHVLVKDLALPGELD
jgi:ribosomal protein S18 acetylase RimI-like enzyme